MNRFVSALVLLGVITAPRVAAQDLVLTRVHVVDVRTGDVLRDHAIVIADGVIARVAPMDELALTNVAPRLVDGRGAYVIPGLLDMHAHVRGNGLPDWITTDWMMPLLLAHGVTGVRDMGSACAPTSGGDACLEKMLAWRQQVDDGTLLGPRLLALSTWPLSPPRGPAPPEEQVRTWLRDFHGNGGDLVKIYYRLTPEHLGWVMDEAATLGLDVAGHIPLRVATAEASAAGLRSIEHARDLLFDGHPGGAAFRAQARSQNPTLEEMRAMVEQHDPALCDDIFRTLVANDTWYVPTHVTRRMDAYADDPAFRADPRSRFLPPMLWDQWNADADNMVALAPSPEGRRAMRGFYERGLEITAAAHLAGVGILLGTDGGDSFVFPGSSAHDELGELVKAGLSPLDALRAATLRGAEFLRLTDRFGTVEPGRAADLVLLEANPLDDIDNVRRIRGVVFRGEYLDRARLDAMLEGAEAAAKLPLGQESGTDS